jgi:predicted SprT family Zn-dependent metalloprotease
MANTSVNPHTALYSQLQRASKVFNEELFSGELPEFIFTLQRGKTSVGYFSPDQWSNADGDLASEIAINPCFLATQSLLQLFQTIVHELCHLWQHQHGLHRPRPGYHNQEWAEKMVEIGLVPSSTGKPGGNKVGQKMADYPAPDGKFIKVSSALVESGFGLKWVDRDFNIKQVSYRTMPAELADRLSSPLRDSFPELVPLIKKGREEKRKIKYSCPECSARVWGKPGLAIICACCNHKLVNDHANNY